MIGTPGLAAYCASKGTVRLLTKAAAVECARFGFGIRVNSVHPGLIETAMLENLFRETVEMGISTDKQSSRDLAFAQQPMADVRAMPQGHRERDPVPGLRCRALRDRLRVRRGRRLHRPPSSEGGFTAAA